MEWDTVVRIAEANRLTVIADRPARLETRPFTGVRFVQFDDDLWQASSEGLYGDDRHRSLADLTLDERRRHAEVLELELCQCGMCARLRPDHAALDGFLTSLRGVEPVPARSEAWFLVRTNRSTPEILTAMLEAGGALGGYEGFADLVGPVRP